MISKITYVELIPEEGKWLTQSEESVEERVFSTKIYCPNGQENNWIEVDNTYKEQWELEHPIEPPI